MKLLHFILGLIYFKAQGGFNERFLNLCKLAGVKLYYLRDDGESISAAVSIKGFKKIRTAAAKSGMRIKVVSKKGLPFIYAAFSSRKGLLLGIAVMSFLLFFYSRSIWRIDVTGNKNIKSEKIIAVLEENNVKLGMFKKDFKNNELKLKIYERLPEVAWVNFNIDGSRLVVDLREATAKPDSEGDNYCNIVASGDGVIKKIVLYEGESVIKEGEAVKEGQLLVSGVIFHEQAKLNTFHHAKAEIFAQTKTKTVIKIPKVQKITSYTGRSRTYKQLNIFRLKLPLYIINTHYKNEESTTLEFPLIINNVRLPVSVSNTMLKELGVKNKKISLTDAEALARDKKRAFEKRFITGTKIIKTTVNKKESESEYIFTYSYVLYENIAETSNIEIGK